ncbi:uncharacterized protein [Sylvia atricapilla]|uniref:uncharacterized protein n=1 Tax=Sylvia atricapilla TaxID=48155 RepID=UPI003397928F
MLKALVPVVATLGELAATMAGLDSKVLLALYQGPLHKELRIFSQCLRDTLDHGSVTSLGQRGVTSLSQALATTGDVWSDVRAVVNAWQEWLAMLDKRWDSLVVKAKRISFIFEYRIPETDLVWYLEDEPTNWGVAEDNLLVTAKVVLMAPVSVPAYETREEARRRQQVKEALGLVYRFEDACRAASKIPEELQNCLRSIEDALVWTQEASPSVLEDLVDAVKEFDWLWEGSASLARDHLLGTLGVIDFLLSSPYGNSSGLISPVDPGSPNDRLVAKHCLRSIMDILRSRQRQQQRTAPLSDKTNNGSSVTGTPEQPQGNWGKPKPGAVCETASHLPNNPNLLPPGTRCELVTSKLIRFLKDCCHEWIPIEVPGISQQRQDFLIIGKDRNALRGLSVIPAVVSANCNKELRVLALAHKAQVVIQPKTPIAIAIALPMNINKRAGYLEIPSKGFNPVPNVRWVKRITNEQPELECSLTYGDKTVYITGMLDTGADVTAIFHKHWPSDWNLVPPKCFLTGFGGATECMQSEFMITVRGPEGKTASIRPYIVEDYSTVWGRDVMSKWGTKMEVDS